jgi:hypothetical protein
VTTVSSIISIRSFEYESDEFHRALSIYTQEVHYQAHTDTNEIIYWMNHASEHPYARLYFCGLYLSTDLIGYAQFAFFKREQLIHVDYLVVAREKRPGKRFNAFAEQLEDFIAAEQLDFTLLTAEVSLVDEDEGSNAYSAKLQRLFRWAGLGELKVSYAQPMLGWGKRHTGVPAKLMLAAPSRITRLNTSRYIEVLTTIYIKHYQAWYKPIYPNDDADYGLYLSVLLNEAKKNLETVKYLEVDAPEHPWGSDLDQKIVVKSQSPVVYVVQLVISALAAILLHWILAQKTGLNPYLLALAAISFFVLCAILARFSSGGRLETLKWIIALARDFFNH